MSTSKKKFTMTRVFVDLLDYAEDYEDFHLGEEHFHMHWNIYLSRENGNAELLFFLNDLDPVDEDSESTDETFFIEAEIDVQMLLENRRIEIKNQKVICQSLDDDYFHKVRLMSWEDLRRKCSVYGEVKIEVHFEITKMSGVLARKTFLSFQSTYFKALLLGNFEESKKSEVILQDIDHRDFQKFLEVLYGGNAIDDDYFENILRLADMYDAPIARRKCEEFLMEKSKKSLKEKLELSMEYNMENVKGKCLSDIKTVADIRSVVPENLEEMDHSLMATLFQKALNLNLCQYNGNVEFYAISSLTEDDGSVAGSVDSDWSEPDGEEYCVETELDIKLTFADGKKIEEKRKFEFKNGDDSMHEFMCIPWSDLKRECSVDGKVKVEVRVKILKATGTETKKLMNFDEAMKDFSDAVLVVKKEKFYISKLFLAYQSTYFKSLLLGSFKESKKSEIALKDIDPEDFQKFLEVLYGEVAVDDDTVEGIAHLADMYDAPKALKRCEQFLMKKSRKSLKSKLELSAKYNMDGVKNKCLGDIKSVADIQSVLPENLEEMDHSVMASVLRKAMSHLV
ncbi:hypothetical protein GCK72_007472 [Caenorhabditis remanei]|uniref:BTB domain-containing protein n=1 Tax=Caenorhabditis remanei TaxID=31234 RepID=A0A6A5HMB8_CAERE|nr:hypothetical protein GCK72_007472 [Caenorhabditis remanei]KAF1767513.1 hypothetical protein GCK72_007472 [Caenorhabditis remanei]